MAQRQTLLLPGFDNRRRAFIIASFLALTTVLAALNLFPWQPPAILLVWLGVIKATERLLSRQTSERSMLRVATLAFCADTLFVSACAFFLGGAMWMATAFYLFLVMVAASMLPLRNALRVAGCAIAGFAFLVLGEVSGEISRPPFFGIPDYAGNYQLGLTTLVVAATTMGLALMVQQSLVAAIRRSEQSHSLVLEAASDMIATLDQSGRILRVNDAVREQTGYAREHLLGANLTMLATPSFSATLERQIEFVRLGSRIPIEGSYVHAGGSERWLSGTLTPIPDGDSGAGMLLIARDVTRDKAAERERERLRNELAQALRIQALGRLVSGVAHELNNPLTAILTTADDLLDGHEASPDDRESLGIIRQQAHRARTIVRDLASFVRSGSERKHERILPSAALAEALATARLQIELIGARLEIGIAPNMEPVEVDRAGFGQVITNIVLNAAQAAGAGGIVAVRGRIVGGFCEIVVEDNGPGIASDVLAHIFEPFYTTKTAGKGTGLGLSLSVGIVEHYEGTIVAENRSYAAEGSSGARFTVRLPVASNRDVALASAPAPAPATAAAVSGTGQAAQDAQAATLSGGTQTALVIDDEDSIRRALRRYLERFGWTVYDVPSAIEALPLLVSAGAEDRYAVIICDIKMPGMTGIELCQRIRTEAPALSHRFVLTSGNLAEHEREIRDCSLGGTLAKPYDVVELRALVDRIANAVAPA
ncbi:MAG: hybrid sensor histidine kinase/response regulator [Gemmatimonadaceae bacterium]